MQSMVVIHDADSVCVLHLRYPEGAMNTVACCDNSIDNSLR